MTKLDFSAQAVGDIISKAIESTPKADANPVVLTYCMEDFRLASQVAIPVTFFQLIKSLEGKTITKVEWLEGEKPYLRNLSITTE